ncbi:MAG: extradiol ring-cleavage dioxygenase [Nitrososphaerota archaeon]|nr:extradiol ring-cleavage dioxygenase [Nitrososphaerota archaeon]MDG7023905.1 extradiol ring-cleavage dioxygenase [Nitrososphaerota archaeon]
MPLVYACIAPHGGEVVPALAGKKLRLFAPTRKAMKALALEMKQARPDTIVVATPHNLRLQKHIGVVTSQYSSGTVTEGRRAIRLRATCDVAFADRVVDEAEKQGLPVVAANYGALEGPLSNLAMDWGTLIPLWFFLRGGGSKRKVVIVTPSRGIPLRQNFEFGRALARVAEREKKRVAFVASADQAHAHKKNGPYGFDSRAAAYDRRAADLVRQGSLEGIMEFDPGFVEGAKPDSLWQMTMLAGALSVVPMKGELLSYQVPTYFGMLCASYRP